MKVNITWIQLEQEQSGDGVLGTFTSSTLNTNFLASRL
jgi:hypothetical protein